MDIRVSLFDDSASIRESLGELLRYTKGIFLTGLHADAVSVEDIIALERPQIVLMDIDMPGISGIEAVARIRQAAPGTLVIMLTVFEEAERVYAALQAGAMGYLLKSTPPDALIAAIREAHEGGAPMTPSIARKVLLQWHAPPAASADHGLNAREREVLQCLVDGLSYKMVGDKLGISINTVRSHIKHIYEKLHVRSNTEAVAKTINQRLLG
jgi:DNA-binding NarL/FixJ family response regulator